MFGVADDRVVNAACQIGSSKLHARTRGDARTSTPQDARTAHGIHPAAAPQAGRIGSHRVLRRQRGTTSAR
jgi:hypothetical protein